MKSLRLYASIFVVAFYVSISGYGQEINGDGSPIRIKRKYNEKNLLKLHLVMPSGGFKAGSSPNLLTPADPYAAKVQPFIKILPVIERAVLNIDRNSLQVTLLDKQPYGLPDTWNKKEQKRLRALFFLFESPGLRLDLKVSQSGSMISVDKYYINQVPKQLGPAPAVKTMGRGLRWPILESPNQKASKGKQEERRMKGDLFPVLKKPVQGKEGAFTKRLIGEHIIHAEGPSDDPQSRWYLIAFCRGLTVVEIRLTVTKTSRRKYDRPEFWRRRLDHVATCLDQYVQWNMWTPEFLIKENEKGKDTKVKDPEER